MSLRIVLAILFFVNLLAAFGVIFASIWFMSSQLSTLFPEIIGRGDDEVLYTLLAGQAIFSIIVSAFMLAGMFWLLMALIAKPLKEVVYAMQAFAERGERVALPDMPFAPKEMRTLLQVFTQFADRVEEAHQKDVEVSRVKSDFISTAAHQLRTPLTGIRWALEALEKSNITEEQKVLVKSATDKSHELVAIVGTLLDISSIESGKYKYDFKPVDVQALAEEVVRDFSPFAQKSQIQLYVERNENHVSRVRADHERIKWVLNNLVENAIRYTPAGGSVRLSAEERGPFVYLRVRDTGIGISEKDRANIFQRFYRAQNAIVVQNGGNGLGLYIARTIATDHGGDLTFAGNDSGPGTTFTLNLPVAE